MKKKNRVKKYLEFKKILNKRKFYRNSRYCLYYQENELDYARVGILVTKKNGNAVIRNKIKRQVRSVIDEAMDFTKSLDVIVVISQKYDTNEFEYNKGKLIELFLALLGEKK